MTTPLLQVQDLVKSFPGPGRDRAATTILDGISFDVEDGEFFTIVGPSGAGKTTLLRCLAGLLSPTSGRVLLDGAVVDGPPRDLGVVFQDYSRSLYPWLTVARNVGLPLVAQGVARVEVDERVTRALAEVGLADHADKHPWQLSGGMQQRAAIARAIAYRARILVLDEPFASVDAQTRAELEDLLLAVREETQATFVFVTHDVDEAVYLSDRVAVVTRSPSRIRRVIDVNLPRSRDQLSTRADPHFGALRTEVLASIRAVALGNPPDYSI